MHEKTPLSIGTEALFMERKAHFGFVLIIGRDFILEFMLTMCIIALGSVRADSKLLKVATEFCFDFGLISAHAAFSISYIF